jgi:hypothetical protein
MAKTVPISEETASSLSRLQALLEKETKHPVSFTQKQATAVAISEAVAKREKKQ